MNLNIILLLLKSVKILIIINLIYNHWESKDIKSWIFKLVIDLRSILF